MAFLSNTSLSNYLIRQLMVILEPKTKKLFKLQTWYLT